MDGAQFSLIWHSTLSNHGEATRMRLHGSQPPEELLEEKHSKEPQTGHHEQEDAVNHHGSLLSSLRLQSQHGTRERCAMRTPHAEGLTTQTQYRRASDTQG